MDQEIYHSIKKNQDHFGIENTIFEYNKFHFNIYVHITFLSIKLLGNDHMDFFTDS